MTNLEHRRSIIDVLIPNARARANESSVLTFNDKGFLSFSMVARLKSYHHSNIIVSRYWRKMVIIWINRDILDIDI